MIANAARRTSGRRPAAACLVLLFFMAGAARTAPARQAQEPLPGQSMTGPREGIVLYRFLLIQAAPGKLLELIDLEKTLARAAAAGGEETPYIVRHSQGDHWDLAVVIPCGSFADYFGGERPVRREAAVSAAGFPPAELARRLDALISWQEDLYVLGPPIASFREHVKEAGLLHFEMMQSLPGKREALIEERRMENAFARERGRGQTLIFVRVQGAAWDVVTLAAYRSWRHYAESDAVPPEAVEAAARKAGFPNAAGVGPYMRTLISTHRDTLGPPVRTP